MTAITTTGTAYAKASVGMNSVGSLGVKTVIAE